MALFLPPRSTLVPLRSILRLARHIEVVRKQAQHIGLAEEHSKLAAQVGLSVGKLALPRNIQERRMVPRRLALERK